MESSQNPVKPLARKQDWEMLIQRLAGGEPSALTTLYDSTSGLVFGLVMRVLGDRSMAEEVLLDVYTQIWRQAAAYDKKRGAPLAWIMTIARSRAIDRLRLGRLELQRREPLEAAYNEPSTLASPEEATAASERQELVRSALEALSAEQRQVIELAYYSGLSHSEIAAQLGQPPGTVKTRVRLGMIRLRELLWPMLEGFL